MFYVSLIFVGILSGTLGGMGMGGGTLLIPLLTLIFNFNQKMVQGINLISFTIMAIVIVIIHIKNKLIDVRVALGFFCCAIVTTVLGAYLASVVSGKNLKFCYGILLILIAIYQVVGEIKNLKNNPKDNKSS